MLYIIPLLFLLVICIPALRFPPGFGLSYPCYICYRMWGLERFFPFPFTRGLSCLAFWISPVSGLLSGRWHFLLAPSPPFALLAPFLFFFCFSCSCMVSSYFFFCPCRRKGFPGRPPQQAFIYLSFPLAPLPFRFIPLWCYSRVAGCRQANKSEDG